jgi:Ser/Thr protein kinase RdoA (MazF antagonist)
MDLLGSGREADVYAIDSRRVLRRYRRGDDVTAEAELMTYLAGHGYPVPHVHSATGADMVLERLDGATMTEAFAAGELGVDAGAAILVDLHERLHRLPSRSGRDRILHRDLHPENVMVTSLGPVVIDWHNAAEGRPAVDVCLTAIIMAQVAVDPGHPHAAAAAAFLTAFLTRAGDDPLAGLDEALEIRRADPSLTPDSAAGLAAAVTPLILGALR